MCSAVTDNVVLERLVLAALLEFHTLRDLEEHTDQQLQQLDAARKRYGLMLTFHTVMLVKKQAL